MRMMLTSVLIVTGDNALGLVRMGTIAEGKLADLVILDGPFAEFSTARRTVAVLKSGRFVHGPLPTRQWVASPITARCRALSLTLPTCRETANRGQMLYWPAISVASPRYWA
jgi:hypothetical protein